MSLHLICILDSHWCAGIYFALHSSKRYEMCIQYAIYYLVDICISYHTTLSHDYTRGSDGVGLRAILLSNVLLGRAYEEKGDLQYLSQPPDGFHSVKVGCWSSLDEG